MQEALTCGLPVETLSNTFLFKGARQVIYTDCLLVREHCLIQLQYFFTTIRQHLKSIQLIRSVTLTKTITQALQWKIH